MCVASYGKLCSVQTDEELNINKSSQMLETCCIVATIIDLNLFWFTHILLNYTVH